jgi:hypothetical protein
LVVEVVVVHGLTPWLGSAMCSRKPLLAAATDSSSSPWVAGLKRELGDLDRVSAWLMVYDWYNLPSTADREVAIESSRA